MPNKPQKPGVPQRKGAKRGPKADLLKIRGKWQDAVRQSLQKKKPESGWPK